VKLNLNCRAPEPLALALALLLVPQCAFAQAVSPIDFGAASLADPRLGVAIATMAELADTPALLARPSSQQFIDDAFARVLATAPQDAIVRAHAGRWRDALRVTQEPFDRTAAYAAVGDLSKNVLRAAGSPSDRLIALGILAQQTFYNARVLRDPGIDGGDRAAIGANDAADNLYDGLKDMRYELASLGFKQWSQSADGAQKIVGTLLGSSFAVPFPPSPAVWVVLLRARTTGFDAARKSEHYWLDVVRFDGSHQTYGGYPNGTQEFGRDAGRLACVPGKELDTTSDRTIPVPPGPASTSAQLADSIEHLCEAANHAGLRYRVRDADDDRLVADLLFRSGVLVGPVLRAAAERLPK
jgi:hypothetical protein